MIIQSLANGNVVDLPEDQARALVERGLFKHLEKEAEEVTTRNVRKYKRRDMKAER